MRTFHSLRVVELRRETPDCVSVLLAVPEELRASFAFLPGQYLTFRQWIGGEELRRSYSICAAPAEGELRVAVKQVSEGRFSTFVNRDLEPGAMLDVMPPMGHFVWKSEDADRGHDVFFAAGSGITPILSMLKAGLASAPERRFTLVYGNSRSDSIIFLEELEALKNRYLGRLAIHHVLSREFPGSDLFFGRISEEKCDALLGKVLDVTAVDRFYICGPNDMLEAVRSSLTRHGVEASRIHVERFSSEGLPASKPAGVKTGKPFAVEVEITQDGNIFHFSMDSRSETLLDAAQRSGGDLPYACKGGVCCTCMARLSEGKVEMALNYALEEDQLAQGYILTCQSYPLTTTLKIDFD